MNYALMCTSKTNHEHTKENEMILLFVTWIQHVPVKETIMKIHRDEINKKERLVDEHQTTNV